MTKVISPEKFDIYILTWNVGSKYPENVDVRNLLGLGTNLNETCNGRDPDLYAIGFQEVNAQPQNQVFSFFRDDPWTTHIKGILKHGDYVAVKTEQMQGILLIIFSKRKHLMHLRDIEAQYTRTGFGGLWGNKGGVSIRMTVYGCGVTFMNSHLAAHDHELNERIVDYKQILDNHHYHVKRFRAVYDHDYVFWFGDLNFRLQYEDNTTPEQVRDLVEKEKLKELIDRDQLSLVRREGKAFYQLEEREPAFPPTFKFEEGTSKYDMKRRPAWTDRILWRVQHDSYTTVKLDVEQISYKSHPSYTISDHKPVSSEFLIRVFESPVEYDIEFLPIPTWYIGDVHIIEYKVPKEFEEQDSDWIGIYKKDFSSFSEYVAYEYTNQAGTKKSETNSSSTHKIINMTFSETIELVEGQEYVLIYFSNTGIRGITSCVGMSQPFEVARRPISPRFEAVD